MATGVPKANGASKSLLRSLDKRWLHLDYPGKKPEADILSVAASSVSLLFSASNADPLKRLYYGDNLYLLRYLLDDPTVSGKISLIYIDPPFSTKTTFQTRNLQHAYEDVLEGGDFLEYIRERLVLLRELLSPEGSIYIHIDEKMLCHLKIVMDELFGADNYRNLITRKKCNPKNYTRKKYGNVADYILFYTKSNSYVWNRPIETWTDDRAKEYQYIDKATGRRFMKVPLHAPGVRHGETGKSWRGMLPPPGKHWQFPPSTLDKMDKGGEIYWSPTGNPRRKVYLDQNPGPTVQDIWLDYKDAHNQNIKITGYPTEKNPEILKRIILASSNPGDLVLDAFSGSGTTLAVADHALRKWLGIDNSKEAIRLTLRRFAIGTETMGDYVTSRNGEEAKSDNLDSEPTLFGWTEQPLTKKKVDANYEPICDFSLYADSGAVSEMSDIAREWTELQMRTLDRIFDSGK
jgi:adenine-specific DNA-methyltransferase